MVDMYVILDHHLDAQPHVPDQVDEGERQLAAAKEDSERLLRSVLPESIADRLKKTPGIIADIERHYSPPPHPNPHGHSLKRYFCGSGFILTFSV